MCVKQQKLEAVFLQDLHTGFNSLISMSAAGLCPETSLCRTGCAAFGQTSPVVVYAGVTVTFPSDVMTS